MGDLSVFAGPLAMRRIQAEGLRAADISWLAGASGGPKWFVLYGLDRYLAGDFFATQHAPSRAPLRMIGSSAGAWRLACYAQADSVAAIGRLAQFYSTQTYSKTPDIHEISREARLMLDQVLGSAGAAQIAGNNERRLYVIADAARGRLRSDKTSRLKLGLSAAALMNLLGRRQLARFFERVVFHSQCDAPGFFTFEDLPTHYHGITPENVREVLMASGSIPLVMEAVRGIAGLEDMVFRDGGITDYHLNLPFNQVEGLVLYPHFYAGIVPGWFDRFAPWRRVNEKYFDNVVLLAPSADFVKRLPYAKIPDRNDFRHLSDAGRLRYWQTVLSESERLAEGLRDLVEHGKGIEHIRPFRPWRKKHV